MRRAKVNMQTCLCVRKRERERESEREREKEVEETYACVCACVTTSTIFNLKKNNYSKYCCMLSYRIIVEDDVLTLTRYNRIVTNEQNRNRSNSSDETTTLSLRVAVQFQRCRSILSYN